MKKTIAFLLVILLLSGCAVQPAKEQVTLKVLYHSTDEFMNKYGKVYLASTENIDFEIIPVEGGLTIEQYLEIVETEKPDILSNFDYYEYFVDEGKLLNLDTYIEKSKDFRMDQINSNLLDYLRQEGNGSIYALSPTFTGKAMYYNKTILDQLGVEYPIDGMNWNELLELSSRISRADDTIDNEIISFYYDRTLFDLAMNIADTMKVQYANESGDVTFNTEGWNNIMNVVIENARNGAVFTRDNYPELTPFDNSKFSNGIVALTVDYSDLINDLRNVDFEWGVVTVPTDSSLESVDAMQPNELFGVNRDSSHIEESVDFITYINGEKFAQLEQKSSTFSSLPAREEFSKQIVNVDLHAFYHVAPLNFTRLDPFISREQSNQFYEATDEIMQDAITNETSTAEVIKLLQDTTEVIVMNE
ncbi:MAG: ABC transporter substrate-binding protein [Candidatus Pristimantibacillus lignocellulolyticus]|uniref:ABC transporter substrate-binding protein n=1 Tax=Candidatus Pristimantibacillus lignocellulolyticus TaxID=2994561 RepID=A0A9J6Z9D4_9BACL|nr:MAG: ABC transporter substrate-binding protein [Candidatus Pristimantibacillus lignocellulolyticus]